MISVATSFGTLLGMWLVSRKDWRGWLIGLCNQVLWLVLIIQTHAWGLLILLVALVVLYSKAIVSWRRDERRSRLACTAACYGGHTLTWPCELSVMTP